MIIKDYIIEDNELLIFEENLQINIDLNQFSVFTKLKLKDKPQINIKVYENLNLYIGFSKNINQRPVKIELKDLIKKERGDNLLLMFDKFTLYFIKYDKNAKYLWFDDRIYLSS